MNKLVRDKIPDIIKVSGKTPEIFMLDDDQMKRATMCKIIEEANELNDAFVSNNHVGVVEELADLYEIISAFCNANNISQRDIRAARKLKNEIRGQYNNRVFLKRIY